jgi:uncharacterized membrane protein YebE (DUF533 family)
MEKPKMKFIRKGGKVIPIREKKDGNADKRHVSDKKLAQKASNMKPKTKNQVTGVLAGAATGAIVGSKKLGSKFSASGAVIGGLLGLGLGSMRVKTKQEVANADRDQMERDFKREKPVAYKKYKSSLKGTKKK